MRIIHVMECFAGGTFNFLVDLTKEISSEEHIIIYGTNRENIPTNFEKLFSPNVKFIKWQTAQREMKPLKDIKALWELYIILKNIKNIDVIHLHSSKAGFLGRIASFLLGKSNRVIYTPHAISFLRLDISPMKRNIFIWMEKFASLFGGKIVACSESEKEAIIEHGIRNVTFINNGINPFLIEKKINTTDKITIISVGRLSIQKNPKLFNDIALSFINNSNIQFIWCGDGELKSKLNSPNIRCTGWIERKDLEIYLSKADIYLSTSLWEGLPLSVLEAMSIGLPLILSNCIGNKDLVKNNGFLYRNRSECINNIQKLLNDKILLNKQGISSKKFFKKAFILEDMGINYLKLYKKLNIF